MAKLSKLKEFLNVNADKYRVICSNKKEIKYSKLFDGNSYYNVETENYKVYLKKTEMSYSVESNDISYIINCIVEWLSNFNFSDEIIWYDGSDYPFQEENSFLKNKKIYINFDFYTYHKWLEMLSATVDDKQSFLYYGEVEEVRLLTHDIERKQYLVKSQILRYNAETDDFIINENNVFINDEISENNKSSQEVKEIAEIVNNPNIELIEISPQTLQDVISIVLENFKGENIISLNSFLRKNSFNKVWLDSNVSIFAGSSLSFDKEGVPKKKIPIIEKGVIRNFINTSYAMRVLAGDECGFSEFNSESQGISNEIKYEVDMPSNISLSYHCSIVKSEIPVMLLNEDAINIRIRIQACHELEQYDGIVIFDFKEFIKSLIKSEQSFLISKSLFKILDLSQNNYHLS